VQGAAVPNATIVVISDGTAVRQETRTNQQGNWAIPFLVPGHYHFSWRPKDSKPRFAQASSSRQPTPNKSMFQLEMGAMTQSVEVTAETPLIDTSSATSGPSSPKRR